MNRKNTEECFRCRKKIEDSHFKVEINGTMYPENLPRGGFNVVLCYDCWNGLSEFMWNHGKGLWSRATSHFKRS